MTKPDMTTMTLHGRIACCDPGDVLFHDGQWHEIREAIREGDKVFVPRQYARTFAASHMPGLGRARKIAAREPGRRVFSHGFVFVVEGERAFVERATR